MFSNGEVLWTGETQAGYTILHLMETAQRVLAAVSNKCSAGPGDVEELVKFAGLQPEGMGLEEFACSGIRKVLQHRTEGRRSSQPS